jgi:hypothetical protein
VVPTATVCDFSSSISESDKDILMDFSGILRICLETDKAFNTSLVNKIRVFRNVQMHNALAL